MFPLPIRNDLAKQQNKEIQMKSVESNKEQQTNKLMY